MHCDALFRSALGLSSIVTSEQYRHDITSVCTLLLLLVLFNLRSSVLKLVANTRPSQVTWIQPNDDA